MMASRASALEETLLVTQYEPVKSLGAKYRLKTIWNDKPELGMSYSMALGLRAADIGDGYMILLADQPLISSHLINRLLALFEEDKNCIIVPCYKGRNGNPVIFPADLRKELLEVRGDIGGREIIKKYSGRVKYIECDDMSIIEDIDVEEDMEHMRWKAKKY